MMGRIKVTVILYLHIWAGTLVLADILNDGITDNNMHLKENVRWQIRSNKIHTIRLKRNIVTTEPSTEPSSSSSLISNSTKLYDLSNRQLTDKQLSEHFNNINNHQQQQQQPLQLQQYRETTVIDLSKNELTSIPIDKIHKNFIELRDLNLSENNLTNLIDLRLRNIKYLNLTINQIKTFKCIACNQLKLIDFSCNQISDLTNLSFNNVSELEYLDISCNQINTIQWSTDSIGAIKTLRILNLAQNKINLIRHTDFSHLYNLETLILANNNITVIENGSFVNLPYLEYLDVSNNNLNASSIHALQGIPILSGLSLAYNPELSDALQGFVATWSLKELDMSGTGLCQIPAALAQSVHTLRLADNNFKNIHSGDLDSYPLLQYLNLSSSEIEDIEDDAFGRLELLIVLDLQNNKLNRVPFSLPSNLIYLYLQKNNIYDLVSHQFEHLNELKVLDLSYNKLTYLQGLPLPKLIVLNLRSANIKELSQTILKKSPHLKDLLLEDNPIKCADLLSIVEWATPCRKENFTEQIDSMWMDTETIYNNLTRYNRFCSVSSYQCPLNRRPSSNSKKLSCKNEPITLSVSSSSSAIPVPVASIKRQQSGSQLVNSTNNNIIGNDIFQLMSTEKTITAATTQFNTSDYKKSMTVLSQNIVMSSLPIESSTESIHNITIKLNETNSSDKLNESVSSVPGFQINEINKDPSNQKDPLRLIKEITDHLATHKNDLIKQENENHQHHHQITTTTAPATTLQTFGINKMDMMLQLSASNEKINGTETAKRYVIIDRPTVSPSANKKSYTTTKYLPQIKFNLQQNDEINLYNKKPAIKFTDFIKSNVDKTTATNTTNMDTLIADKNKLKMDNRAQVKNPSNQFNILAMDPNQPIVKKLNQSKKQRTPSPIQSNKLLTNNQNSESSGDAITPSSQLNTEYNKGPQGMNMQKANNSPFTHAPVIHQATINRTSINGLHTSTESSSFPPSTLPLPLPIQTKQNSNITENGKLLLVKQTSKYTNNNTMDSVINWNVNDPISLSSNDTTSKHEKLISTVPQMTNVKGSDPNKQTGNDKMPPALETTDESMLNEEMLLLKKNNREKDEHTNEFRLWHSHPINTTENVKREMLIVTTSRRPIKSIDNNERKLQWENGKLSKVVTKLMATIVSSTTVEPIMQKHKNEIKKNSKLISDNVRNYNRTSIMAIKSEIVPIDIGNNDDDGKEMMAETSMMTQLELNTIPNVNTKNIQHSSVVQLNDDTSSKPLDESIIHTSSSIPEQWNDLRSTTNHHPSLFVVLGVTIGLTLSLGLIHLYRCTSKKPWHSNRRRHYSMSTPTHRDLLPMEIINQTPPYYQDPLPIINMW